MNKHLVQVFEQSADGDEWGNVMSWFFAVAHVLHHLDEIPEEWNYIHAPYCDEDMRDPREFNESELAYLMAEELVTVEDLIEFGHWLDREDERLKAAGKAY